MALISVITIVKDHASGLLETFNNLDEQEFDDWELIIVVGRSNDSSLKIAKDISKGDSRVRVIEQTGLGIYGAMNEGIRDAHGDFSWFMNAGDRFANAQVLALATQEISVSEVGLVIGGYRIESKNGSEAYVFPRKLITEFNFAFSRRGGCHQAMIFRTQTLKDIGGFSEGYSLASDFDLVLKVIKSASALRVPEIYASIEPGGAADQGIFSVHSQKHQIRKIVFKSKVIHLLSLAWTFAARVKISVRRTLHPSK